MTTTGKQTSEAYLKMFQALIKDDTLFFYPITLKYKVLFKIIKISQCLAATLIFCSWQVIFIHVPVLI